MANLIKDNPVDVEYYTVYTAYFNFGNGDRTATLFDYKPFKEGIWLDDDFKYTNDSDRMVYWVPPHRINFVRKEIREIKRGV